MNLHVPIRGCHMDTRNKILSIAQAAALAGALRREASPPSVFLTHVEVLASDHVRRLEHLAARSPGKIFLVLTDSSSPLAPMEARAEMAAALRLVDYVVPAADGPAPALAAIQPLITVEDEEEDCARTQQLIQHVQTRSRI